mgnify:CR=1 FL=1
MNTAKLASLLQTEKAGFTLIQKEASRVVNELSGTESLGLAKKMYKSEVYQARMFATLIFGRLAAHYKEAYEFLGERIVLIPTGALRRCWRGLSINIAKTRVMSKASPT